MKTLALLAIAGGLHTCQFTPHHNTQQKPDIKNGIVHAVPDVGSTLGFLTLGTLGLAVVAFRARRLKG